MRRIRLFAGLTKFNGIVGIDQRQRVLCVRDIASQRLFTEQQWRRRVRMTHTASDCAGGIEDKSLREKGHCQNCSCGKSYARCDALARTEVAPRPGSVSWVKMMQECTLTRSTLADIAACCLSQESSRLYAVYRPFTKQGTGSDSSPPSAFMALVRGLAMAGLAHSSNAQRVVSMLFDLLDKPVHPQYGVMRAWDITKQEEAIIKQAALESMVTALNGVAALAWLQEILGVRHLQRDEEIGAWDAKSVRIEGASLPLVQALAERLQRRKNGESADSFQFIVKEEALLLSSVGMAAVASSLLSLGEVRKEHPNHDSCNLVMSRTAATQQALVLLELAALSQHSLVGGSARRNGEADGIFSEYVVVRCAEAAARIGDAETVTRLMFLLYRVHGALGSATLSDHRTAKRAKRQPTMPLRDQGSSSPAKQFHLSQLFWRFTSTYRRQTQSERSAAGNRDDELFERAVIRLLKSCIHAVLYSRHATTAVETSPLTEALALFESLQGGATWAGAAAMAVELLTYLSADQQDSFSEQNPLTGCESLAMGSHLDIIVHRQESALKVLAVLLKSAPLGHRSAGQDRILATCVEFTMRTFVKIVPVIVEARAAPLLLPLPPQQRETGLYSVATARVVLRLLAQVGKAEQGRLLLYSLAAATTLVASAPENAPDVQGASPTCPFPSSLHSKSDLVRVWSQPSESFDTLLSPLAEYFGTMQSIHHHLVSDVEGELTVETGGLLLLLVCVLASSVACGRSKGFDELTARLCGVEAGSLQAGTQASLQRLFGDWVAMAATPQRRVLWSLLIQVTSIETGRDQNIGFMPPCLCTSLHLHAICASSFGICAYKAVDVTLNRICRSATAPSGVHSELADMIKVLYKYGNVLLVDKEYQSVVDRTMSHYMECTIVTYTANDVVELVRACVATTRSTIVVVNAATVQSMQTKLHFGNERSGTAKIDFTSSSLEKVVRTMFLPLLPPTKRGTRVIFVLTASCMPILRHPSFTEDENKASAPGGLGSSLLKKIVTTQSPSTVLPSENLKASAPIEYSAVAAAPLPDGRYSATSSVSSWDGIREACAISRALREGKLVADNVPEVFLWDESIDNAAAAGGNVNRVIAQVRAQRRVFPISKRRAQLERAKRCISTLLHNGARRPSSAPTTATFEVLTQRNITTTPPSSSAEMHTPTQR